MDRIDDRLQRDTRLPRRPTRRRSLIGAHKPLGDRRAHKLRREPAFASAGNGAFALDGRVVAHGVVRARVVHLGVIDDAVGGVFVGKIGRERVGKRALRRIEHAGRKNLRARAALVNRIAPYIGLFSVKSIGELVAAHVGLELTSVERDRPRDVGRRARAVGLGNHVIAKLARRSRDRAVLAIAGAAPLPRCRVFGGFLLVDIFTVVQGNAALQHRFIRDRMVSLGKVAQIVEGRNLTVDRRLRIKLFAIKRETAVHEAEVVTEHIGELDVRGIRFDAQGHGPGNLGHTIGTLGEGSRLRPRDVTVLGIDLDRPRTRELNDCAATRTGVFIRKLEREIRRNVDVRRIVLKPAFVKREDGLIVLDFPRAGFNGVGARSLYKVAADVVINDDGIGKIIHGDFVADRGRLAVQEVRRKGSV